MQSNPALARPAGASASIPPPPARPSNNQIGANWLRTSSQPFQLPASPSNSAAAETATASAAVATAMIRQNFIGPN